MARSTRNDRLRSTHFSVRAEQGHTGTHNIQTDRRIHGRPILFDATMAIGQAHTESVLRIQHGSEEESREQYLNGQLLGPKRSQQQILLTLCHGMEVVFSWDFRNVVHLRRCSLHLKG